MIMRYDIKASIRYATYKQAKDIWVQTMCHDRTTSCCSAIMERCTIEGSLTRVRKGKAAKRQDPLLRQNQKTRLCYATDATCIWQTYCSRFRRQPNL